MVKFKLYSPPKEGKEIKLKDKKLIVPDNPIIPFITGDGIGPDIMRVAKNRRKKIYFRNKRK